jgi:crossover junction endodeoxyribonuclease RuvC
MIDANIKYVEASPTMIKKFVCGVGKGNAKKENVIKDVYKRWGYEHKSNNVVDAYAIARYLEAENAK